MKVDEFYPPSLKKKKRGYFAYSKKPLENGRTVGIFDNRVQLEDFILFQRFCTTPEGSNVWEHRLEVGDLCNVSWTTVYRIENNYKKRYEQWLLSLKHAPVRPSSHWRQFGDGEKK